MPNSTATAGYSQDSFGAVTDDVSVFVMEGDSVTLNTGLNKTQQDRINWYYNGTRIALINGDPSKSCTDVQCKGGNERFRDRLELDHQTGSLTIMNITNTHSGEYQLLITSGGIDSEKIFIVTVHVVSQRKSVKEGESVTLDPVVTKKPNYVMKWHYNDTLIAEITGNQSKICTDDQCKERFRDRLKLDHQNGSLNITHTRTEDSGEYQLLISSISRRHRRSVSSVKSFDVTVIADPASGPSPAHPGSGPSPGAVAGIVVAVLLVCVASAAGVMYLRHRSSRKGGKEENKQKTSVESPSKEMENFLPTKIDVM